MKNWLQKIINRASLIYESLSNREKRLILLLFASVIVVAISIFFINLNLSVDKYKKQIAKISLHNKKIASLEQKYSHLKTKERQHRLQLVNNKISLFSLLQDVANQLSIQLNDLVESKRNLKKSDITQVSVVVNLKSITIDKLSSFIELTEKYSKDNLVKITRLDIKTRFDNPQLLDVKMTIATYKIG